MEKNKRSLLYFFGLLAICFFMFFLNLGNYGLIDIDETRYVNIAQNMYKTGNYITPYLNFEPFLEKPPLYYWLIVLSYKCFDTINPFVSRFSVAFLAAFGVFATYFFVLNIVKSRLFAFLSSTVLATSFWYTLFSHVAILDLGFCVLSTTALYCGISTLFCKKEFNKKILWYLGYIFLGLSVLQKGLIGVIVPALTLFVIFVIFRRTKEIFKPSYIIPGILLFLIVTIPWHYKVFEANGMLWFREYIIKHHFARFLNSSMEIGRKQPFLFYIPIILGGFLPWTAFFVSGIIKTLKYSIKTIKSTKSIKPLLVHDTNDRALVLISSIGFVVIFLFFSSSSTKLPTYILPLFPFISILTGYFLWGYIKENKNKKSVEIPSFVTYSIFLLAGISGLIYYLLGKIDIGLFLASSFIILSILGIFAVLKNKKIILFGTICAFSIVLSGFSSSEIFNFVINHGQNELEEYSTMASNSNARLVTFGFARKYSMLNHYNKKPVYFIPDTGDDKYIKLKKVLNTSETVYLITKNKKKYNKKYLPEMKQIIKGKKYSLFEIKKPLF